MPKITLDALDKKIIRLLTEDGRISVGKMAQRLEVTPPTVRSRMKSLEEAGMLKIAGMIDPFHHQELTAALIGLNILSYGKLDEILEKLVSLDNVTGAAVIPQVGKVAKSETFVIMKSKAKWVCLPEGLDDW
jgi:Lrp/AsnC family transcriptional regulator for asnA, asnC and gidA